MGRLPKIPGYFLSCLSKALQGTLVFCSYTNLSKKGRLKTCSQNPLL